MQSEIVPVLGDVSQCIAAHKQSTGLDHYSGRIPSSHELAENLASWGLAGYPETNEIEVEY